MCPRVTAFLVDPSLFEIEIQSLRQVKTTRLCAWTSVDSVDDVNYRVKCVKVKYNFSCPHYG